MEMRPEFRLDLEDDARFLGPEFELPAENELIDGLELTDAERDRYDDQILAGLVSP